MDKKDTEMMFGFFELAKRDEARTVLLCIKDPDTKKWGDYELQGRFALHLLRFSFVHMQSVRIKFKRWTRESLR